MYVNKLNHPLLSYFFHRTPVILNIFILHSSPFSTLCLLCKFASFLLSAFFFLLKNSFRNTIRVSNSWIQIRPDILSSLIWIQTVCKGYQQTTLVFVCFLFGLILYVPSTIFSYVGMGLPGLNQY